MLKRPLKLKQTYTLLIHSVYIYYEVELHYGEISFDTSLCMYILPISSVFVLKTIELNCAFVCI